MPDGLADVFGGLHQVIQKKPERTIPLYDEQLDITKVAAVTDRLRVSTHVDERTVLVEDTVERGALELERFVTDRAVLQAPEPRQVGDTLIVSLVEERLVVEKRLFVIEELHIIRTGFTESVAVAETVRTMHATVERADPSPLPGQ